MVRFDVNKIQQESRYNYEKTWLQTGRLLHRTGKHYTLQPPGEPHVLFDYIFRIRSVLLQLGFSEVILPMIVEDTDVIRQYGPEGHIILDRVYYLAGLPRPDIGIPRNIQREICQLVPKIKIEHLQSIFRRYKKGEIEADDLLENMVTHLEITETTATKILGYFPELRQMKPIPTKQTLRSHTTASWFPTLQQIQHRSSLPIQLFSLGYKFRREQKVDSSHLLESWTASLVIMTEEISLEDGQQIVTQLFQQLGHSMVKFVIKKATSKYYAPQMEFEAFIRHPTSGVQLEVGDGGFYSPVSLAQYNISHPVFNFGFGLERLVMIEKNIPDIRQVVYPYYYSEIEFSDNQIAQEITVIEHPYTEALVETIYTAAQQFGNKPTPAQVVIYKGKILEKEVVITLVEKEPGQKLLGPAAFNQLVVKDRSILGVMPQRIPEGAAASGLTYMTGIANYVVYKVEKAIQEGRNHVSIRISIVKRLSDVNLRISESIRRFIEANHAKIDVRGPVFAEFEVQIK